jgi:hypothetical protein
VAAAARKTVRFTQVVERSGQPQPHTLWLPPEKDPELKRAIAADRVMTIEASTGGGKTDVGVVGFDRAHAGNGQFLIFPKSLKRFAGARVVGIKFDLVEQPKLAAPETLKAFARTPTARSKKHPPPAPKTVRELEEEPTEPETPPIAPSVGRNPHAAAASHARDKVKPPGKTTGSKTTHASRQTETSPAHAKAARPTPAEFALLREVRAAIKELQRGKSVAAYERLQRAAAAHSGSK